MRRTVAAIMACAGLPAAGCGRPFNEQVGLVGVPQDAVPALLAEPPPSTLEATPSVRSLDRSDWSAVRLVVPGRQVAHYPTYVSMFHWSPDRGPWDPRYPQAASSVGDRVDTGADAADAAFQPAWAAMLLVISPARMVAGEWPWIEEQSPVERDALVPPAAPWTLQGWFSLPVNAPVLPPMPGPGMSPAGAPGGPPAHTAPASPEPPAPVAPGDDRQTGDGTGAD